MTEIEVPIEQIQEDIHHAVHHSNGVHQSMMNKAALLSALLAVLAAISALLAGHYANEGMIEQIQSSDRWAYYQAKGIKLAISELKKDSLSPEESAAKTEKYKKEQDEIKTEAQEKEHKSQEYLHRHESLAASVTLFQVAIALTAISVLTRRRRFLAVAMGLGIVGALWLAKSLLL